MNTVVIMEANWERPVQAKSTGGKDPGDIGGYSSTNLKALKCEPGTVVHTCNCSTWEAEEEAWAQGLHEIHSEMQGNLDYTDRLCLTKIKDQNKTK